MKALSIHVTDQCNNSCIFCVVSSHKQKKEGVRRKLLYSFLEEYRDQGYEAVNIHGGEALVLDDFLTILDKIKSLHYPEVSLQTNGRKLADLNLAKAICDRGVNLFVISLHGKNALEHETVTQVRGSFRETVEGIRNVKQLGVKVRTNTVTYKGNYLSLEAIAKLSMELGADHLNISAVHPVGRAYKNFALITPEYDEVKQSVFKAVDLWINHKKVVTLEGFPPCTIGEYTKYSIEWDKLQFKLLYHNRMIDNYSDFMETETKIQGEGCRKCVYHNQCGGVYKEYIGFYGWERIRPVHSLEDISEEKEGLLWSRNSDGKERG